MPTFTAIALESLLESNSRNSSRNSSINLKKEKNMIKEVETSNGDGSDVKKPIKHIYISPALYTTPELAPIPDTSFDSVSPSPYVVNHKRRHFLVPEAVNRLDGFEIRSETEEERVVGEVRKDEGDKLVGLMAESSAIVPFVGLQEKYDGSALDAEIFEGKVEGLVQESAVKKDESPDDFFDPREAMSVASCSDADDLQVGRIPVANQSEFYDADEEFLSDGSISNSSLSLGPSFEVELRSIRLKLFEEIERRKKAEDVLFQMRNHWQRISRQLAQVGISFPMNLDITNNNMQAEEDLVEQLCQEIFITRFVSEAIGRGQARAESEAVAESVIESKNQEISRLRDRLQYYEAVNQEMSNRNQEVIEISRRQRHRRKRRQKWVWGLVGLSVTIGASVFAYSYLHSDKHFPADPPDSDASSGTPEYN